MSKGALENGGDELPSLAALSPYARTCARLQEAGADVHKLRGYFEMAGLKPVSMASLNVEVAKGSVDRDQPQAMIKHKHLELMPALLAADFRLGKAYLLGRGLAHTCLRPDGRETLDYAFGPRMVGLKSALADLASALPEHASRSVSLSLTAWEKWVSVRTVDGHALDFDIQWAGVRLALRRQGELWRAVISGEKCAYDMLEPKDYLRAAKGLVVKFCGRLAVILVAVAALLTVGITLLVGTSNGTKVLGAFLAVLSALGITGAGIRARMSGAARQLERGFWGAELDRAVASAVTVELFDLREQVRKVNLPAAGERPKAAENLEVLERFRTAVAKNSARAMTRLLDPHVEFKTSDGDQSGAEEVVAWLSDAPERDEIAAQPDNVLAGRPGFFVVRVPDSSDDVPGSTHVWRLREGRALFWQRFTDVNDARRAAGMARLSG